MPREFRPRFARFFVLSSIVVFSHGVLAQDKPKVPPVSKEEQAMMDAMNKARMPGEQHKLLASLVGNWTFVTRMWIDPAAPPTESTGTASYTAIMGGRFVQGTYTGVMMGMPFEGMGVSGYDNVAKQFQSSWIDNFGTMVMYMTGALDPATKAITYTAAMDDFMKPGTKVKVREVGQARRSRQALHGVVRDARRQGSQDDGDRLHTKEVGVDAGAAGVR